MGLLSLEPTVRRENAGDRRWGPKAPHKDSCQSVRHGEVEQDGVLSLGTKCSCYLQTGNNFCFLHTCHALHSQSEFVDNSTAFAE